jgi:hypothetical protein
MFRLDRCPKRDSMEMLGFDESRVVVILQILARFAASLSARNSETTTQDYSADHHEISISILHSDPSRTTVSPSCSNSKPLITDLLARQQHARARFHGMLILSGSFCIPRAVANPYCSLRQRYASKPQEAKGNSLQNCGWQAGSIPFALPGPVGVVPWPIRRS